MIILNIEYFFFNDLHLIIPTNFIWKNWSNFKKRKIEIYAEFVRLIISEIENLNKSNKKYKDEKRYIDDL